METRSKDIEKAIADDDWRWPWLAAGPIRGPADRPPPCIRCGLVESAFATKRHRCHPTSINAMQVGVDNVERLGRAFRDAFAALAD